MTIEGIAGLHQSWRNLGAKVGAKEFEALSLAPQKRPSWAIFGTKVGAFSAREAVVAALVRALGRPGPQ